MNTTTKIVLAVVALAAVFAAGRFSAPTKVKTLTQIVKVEDKTDKTKTNQKDHKKIIITTTTKPDGTKTSVTTITDDKDTSTKSLNTDDISSSETKSKEITKSNPPVNLSFLAGENILSPGAPIYGGMISKPILGPLTVGVFGMENGLAGVSVGLSF